MFSYPKTPFLSFEDIDMLRTLIENHHTYTGSQKAKEILDHFENYLPKFVKVISPAYKKILKENAAKAASV